MRWFGVIAVDVDAIDAVRELRHAVGHVRIFVDIVNLLPSRMGVLHDLWVVHHVGVGIVDAAKICLAACGEVRVEVAGEFVSEITKS